MTSRIERQCTCDCPDAKFLDFREPKDPPPPPEGGATTPGGGDPGGPSTPPGNKSGDKPKDDRSTILHPDDIFELWMASISAPRNGPQAWRVVAGGLVPQHPSNPLFAGAKARGRVTPRLLAGTAGVLTTFGEPELVPQGADEEVHVPFAQTNCNDQNGKMAAPQYSHAVKGLAMSKCIKNLIIGHEHDHYFDPDLQAACEKRSQQKKKGKYDEQAVKEWNAAVKASECKAYAKDAECLRKLVACCTRDNEKGERKKQHDENCCRCKSVNAALENAVANAAENGCSVSFPKPAGKK